MQALEENLLAWFVKRFLLKKKIEGWWDFLGFGLVLARFEN